MKSAIFSILPVKPRSTIASTRIGLWLSELLDIPLYDDETILDEGPIDHLFIINGSTLYCKSLPELAQAVRQAGQVYWLQNDYTLPPPASVSNAESPFRRAFSERNLVPHYWTTVQSNAGRTPHSAHVNWNVLGWQDTAPRALLRSNCALYYGAYREGRADVFDRLYAMFEGRALAISSTSKKFPDHLRVAPFRERFYEDIASYGLGIYLQDKKSVVGGHSPATRFYEMLSVGLPMVFTVDCIPTLAQYGYDVAPYIIKKETVGDMLRAREYIRDQQRAWVRDFVGDLATQVKALYARTQNG